MPFDATPVKNPVVKVLIEGRRCVETSWCQGTDGLMLGRYCAALAISQQNVDLKLRCDAIKVLASAIYGSTDTDGIVPWNDAPGRTKDDVLAAYDRAIAASLMNETR